MAQYEQDREIYYQQVRELSQKEGICQFFEQQGYAVDQQKFEAKDLLKFYSSVRSLSHAFAEGEFERIVHHNDGGSRFEVYLFETPQAARKELWHQLVKYFRYQDDCNYLFVLARKKPRRDDYQLLNFLLIERNVPTYILRGQIYQQWSLPFIPSAPLNSRGWPFFIKPGYRDEAVLRRLRSFTYTESNAERQHYKLIDTYDKESRGTMDWLPQQVPPFTNRALFSNYFLWRRLPQEDEWQMKRGFRDAYATIRGLYQNARKEAVQQGTEPPFLQLFQPVFQTLGFHIESFSEKGILAYKLYSAQPTFSAITKHAPSLSLRSVSGKQVAESASGYRAIKERASPTPLVLPLPGMEIEEKPLAYCLAYPWGSKLDSLDGMRDKPDPDGNPVARVASLFDAYNPDWLIVTNGQLWRLYTSKAQNRISHYYEVDLATITTLPPSQGRDLFRYFWLFFRATAFQPRATFLRGKQDQVPSFLDYLLKESRQHAQAVEARLKKRVFEKVFLYFAGGFIVYAHQHQLLPSNLEELEAEKSQHNLKLFFRGTLTFLYRLLVLFYAEARNFLPATPDSEYYTYSLEAMKQRLARLLGWVEMEAHRKSRGQHFYDTSKTTLYDELQSLFQIIDEGRPELNVPQYDGGLFMTAPASEDTTPEADSARFLTQYKIPDIYLALGLDHMARDLDEEIRHTEKGNKPADTYSLAFIDYRDLGVRQLGSIYEGILEFTLAFGLKNTPDSTISEIFSSSPTKRNVGRKTSPTRFYFPDERMYLELVQDLHERRSTGSYYTPEPIVKYIVEQTLGPLLRRHFAGLRSKFITIAHEFKKRKGRISVAEAEQEIYEEYQETIDKFFDINIIDPAVGSGHFLVEAVDFIADQMIKELEYLESDKYWHLVSYELRRMRRRILQAVKERGITIDANILSNPILMLQRRILKNCVYGVDSNPMAVELAKVSLWLHCFTPGAPFPFLDHHIKCGNSLLSEQFHILPKELAQHLPLPPLELAAQAMQHISREPDISFNEVLASHTEYNSVERSLAPYKRFLNSWLGDYFGNEQRQKNGQLLSDAHAQYISEHPAHRGQVDIVERDLDNAQNQFFFHWELEFPEIYFLDEMRKGFDAVLGNPPYGWLANTQMGIPRSTLINGFKKMPQYMLVSEGKINLFRLFIIKGLTLLREHGYLGQIIPLSLLSEQDSTCLRRYLLKNQVIVKIDTFPEKDDKEKRVFAESKLSTCVLIAANEASKDKAFEVIEHPEKSLVEVGGRYEATPHDIEVFSREWYAIPLVKSTTAFRLLQRLANDERFVADGDHPRTHQGEINETTMKHLLSTDPASGPEVVRGGNIQRYMFTHARRQGGILYLKEKEYLETARGERTHHTKYLRIGFQRGEAQNTWRRLLFAPLPTPPCYCLDTVSYFLIEEEADFFYVALFNSQLMEWLFRCTSTNNHISKREIAALPIRRINRVTPTSEREQILTTLNRYADTKRHDLILQEVTRALSQQPEAATDIVRDLLASLAQKMIELNQRKIFHQKSLVTNQVP